MAALYLLILQTLLWLKPCYLEFAQPKLIAEHHDDSFIRDLEALTKADLPKITSISGNVDLKMLHCLLN